MAGRLVIVKSGDESMISVPQSLLNVAPAGTEIQFGPPSAPFCLRLSDPTPHEARLFSPPQKRESRAYRARIQKEKTSVLQAPSVHSAEQKAPIRTIAEKVIRKGPRNSVFERLSHVSTETRQEPNLELELVDGRHQVVSTFPQSAISKCARRNKARRAHKKALRRGATELDLKNSVSVLSDVEKVRDSSPKRETSRPSGVKPQFPHYTQHPRSPIRERLSSAVREVKRKGLNARTQSHVRETLNDVKSGRLSDGVSKYKAPVHIPRSYPSFKRRQTQEQSVTTPSAYYGRGKAPVYDSFASSSRETRQAPVQSRLSHQHTHNVWKRKGVADVESRSVTTRPRLSHQRSQNVWKRQEVKMVDIEAVAEKSLSEYSAKENKIYSVIKTKEKLQLPSICEALPLPPMEEHEVSWRRRSEVVKEKETAKLPSADSESSDDDLMEDELQKYTSSASIRMIEHICMVDTRSSTRLLESAPETLVGDRDEEEQHEEQQDIIALLQQSDDQIIALKKQMDDMMKSFATMTAQMGAAKNVAQSVPSMVTSGTHGGDGVRLVMGDSPSAAQAPLQHKTLSSPVQIDAQVLTNQNTLDEMVKKSVQSALSDREGVIKRGRPYPVEYEQVQYPKGFVSPKFKLFEGIGNPKQHVAQFRASCCNAGSTDALLLRLFVTSLSGVAFTWFADIPNNSVKTFDELENMFIKRFVSTEQKVIVGDLILEKRKPLESLSQYIVRWRNLSMQCEPQLNEGHAVDIILKNIDGPMAPYLRGFEIQTFKVLLSKVVALQPVVPDSVVILVPDKERKGKYNQASQITKRKETQVSVVQEKDRVKEVVSTKEPNRPMYKQSFEERSSKKYSFRKDAVLSLFKILIKNGLKLPEPRKPEEVDQNDHPKYCAYHRMIGHKTEDCWVFKDLLEEKLQKKEFDIAKKYRVSEATAHVVQHQPSEER